MPWSRLVAALGAMLLAAAAVRCPGADWTDTRKAGPFTCRADFSLAAHDGLLGDLAQLQTDLTRSLGIAPAGEQIEVYLFHDQATYARYLGRYLPGVPYRRALYVKGNAPGRVFAYKGEQFEMDLRHECTHALLHAALPQVPLWLDEGLAVYFQLPGGATGLPQSPPRPRRPGRARRSLRRRWRHGEGRRDGRHGTGRIPRLLGVGSFYAPRTGGRPRRVDRLSCRSPPPVAGVVAAEPEWPPSPTDAGRAAAVSRPLPQLATLKEKGPGARGRGPGKEKPPDCVRGASVGRLISPPG